MRKVRVTDFVLVVGLVVVLCGCGRSGTEELETKQADTTGRPFVFVSNYPLQYFAERIGSPLIEVTFPGQSATDPAYWKPELDDLVRMQKAELLILNGATYEKWVDNVSLPQAKVLETAKGFSDRLIPLDEAVTHSHGPEGEHEHTGTAFTTWLDMTLAVEQARAIKEAFASRWPELKPRFEEQFTKLEQELLTLDAKIKETISVAPETPVIFSHPVYQYFTHRYGINAKSVHWEPDEMPHESLWKALTEEQLKDHKAEWMIWEGEPLPEIAEKLKQLGISSVVFDPCATPPEEGDFLTMMQKNAEALTSVFTTP